MRGEPRIARVMAPAFFRLRRPRTPVRGTDLVGVVVAVGDQVSQWATGDRVFGQGTGTFAEYAVARADEVAAPPRRARRRPCGCPPARRIHRAAVPRVRCSRRRAASILINGASGGVGTFAVQIARSMGLHVTAVVSPRNAAAGPAPRRGPRVDYTQADFTASGDRHDVVLDLVGNRSLRDLRRTVRPGGALVLSGGGTPGSGRVIGPFRLLVQAQLAARKADISIHVPKAGPTTARLERLAALVEGGDVTPVVDRWYPLAETAGRGRSTWSRCIRRARSSFASRDAQSSRPPRPRTRWAADGSGPSTDAVPTCHRRPGDTLVEGGEGPSRIGGEGLCGEPP